MPIQLSEKHEHILEFLQKHKVGVLASVDPNGEPDAATIYFTVDDSLNISFLTKTGTKKHDNLQRHNQATLVVFDAASQTTVRIKGTVSATNDPIQMQRVFTTILNTAMDTSDGGTLPISKLEAGGYIVYQLKPSEIRMAVFTKPERGDYSDLFEIVNP